MVPLPLPAVLDVTGTGGVGFLGGGTLGDGGPLAKKRRAAVRRVLAWVPLRNKRLRWDRTTEYIVEGFKVLKYQKGMKQLCFTK